MEGLTEISVIVILLAGMCLFLEGIILLQIMRMKKQVLQRLSGKQEEKKQVESTVEGVGQQAEGIAQMEAEIRKKETKEGAAELLDEVLSEVFS